MHGDRFVARADMYVSSADVSSIRRVKWVVIASKVAMFARRNVPRVFWITLIRVVSEESVAVVLYIVLIISYVCDETMGSGSSRR
jgi:hypothetical protein